MKYEIHYKPSFIRQYKKLDEGLKNDIKKSRKNDTKNADYNRGG